MGPLARIIGVSVLSVFALAAAPRDAGAHDRGPHAGVSVTADYFYDHLSPYGDWVLVEPYGWVWMPAGVGPHWRPYTVGHWAYADCGWMWMSYEPWGWAAFHYGRWAYEPFYGWIWVPGLVWAPAWVAWRWGGGYIGWAPLGPVHGHHVDYYGPPSVHVSVGWSFVVERDMTSQRVHDVIVPESRASRLLGATKDITQIERDGERVVNRGVDPRIIERVTGRPVPVKRVVDAAALDEHGRSEDRALHVFRPKVAPAERGAGKVAAGIPGGGEARRPPVVGKPWRAEPAVETSPSRPGAGAPAVKARGKAKSPPAASEQPSASARKNAPAQSLSRPQPSTPKRAAPAGASAAAAKKQARGGGRH